MERGLDDGLLSSNTSPVGRGGGETIECDCPVVSLAMKKKEGLQ
jgi:hypothetical protein